MSWLKDWWRLEGVLALYCLSYSVSWCRGNNSDLILIYIDSDYGDRAELKRLRGYGRDSGEVGTRVFVSGAEAETSIVPILLGGL